MIELEDLPPAWRLFGVRLAAYAVDIVLLFVILGPAGWFAQKLLGISPVTGLEIWLTLLLNFSLPTWLYFTLCESSPRRATFGKRWLGIEVTLENGQRLTPGKALGRTAIKLLPWELVHVSAFGLAAESGDWLAWQTVGLVLANAAVLVYLALAVKTRGRKSVHDFFAGTAVDFA